MKLTNLDIIRTENLLNSIFDFENETPPYNKAFEEAGKVSMESRRRQGKTVD